MMEVKVAVNQSFDLSIVTNGAARGDFTKVVLTRIEYVNDKGVMDVHPITGSDPTVMGSGEYRLAYVTKLNNQRWGVSLRVNYQNRGFVAVDIDSPIRSLTFTLSK